MVPQNLAILADYDDTVADHNVAELLLARFAPRSWCNLRAQARARQLSLRQYQEGAFALVRATRQEMQEYVAEYARLRPGFGSLVQFCQENQIPLAIVSNGLDFYIEALLRRNGLDHVPIYAVGTRVPAGRLRYFYPYATSTCREWGNCKCLVMERYLHLGHRVAFIGDSRMDFCPASRADFVFARSALLQQCQETGTAHWPFRDFYKVLGTLRDTGQ